MACGTTNCACVEGDVVATEHEVIPDKVTSILSVAMEVEPEEGAVPASEEPKVVTLPVKKNTEIPYVL